MELVRFTIEMSDKLAKKLPPYVHHEFLMNVFDISDSRARSLYMRLKTSDSVIINGTYKQFTKYSAARNIGKSNELLGNIWKFPVVVELIEDETSLIDRPVEMRPGLRYVGEK